MAEATEAGKQTTEKASRAKDNHAKLHHDPVPQTYVVKNRVRAARKSETARNAAVNAGIFAGDAWFDGDDCVFARIGVWE